MTTVALIDYGSGNLHSAAKALEKAGATVVLATNGGQLLAATHIVLPGVGAFADCMQGLQRSALIPVLEEQVLRGKKPFLGICVGMQLLAETSAEHGDHQGLGWIQGTVQPFEVPNTLKIPHMGWNDIQYLTQHPLLKDINSGTDFYFVHSYHFSGNKAGQVLATCNYGQDFPAIVANNNIMGMQFHPEKSQHAGLKLLENFLNIA